jgi:sialidase-1
MRNHPSRPDGNYRVVATSADGGRTLSAVRFDRTLVEPPAQASLLSIAGARGGGRWVAFANPASTKRERMTVRLSKDDAVSWAITRVVDEGPSSYSSLVELGEDLGLLYERGARNAYEEIVFTRLTRGWLVGAP